MLCGCSYKINQDLGTVAFLWTMLYPTAAEMYQSSVQKWSQKEGQPHSVKKESKPTDPKVVNEKVATAITEETKRALLDKYIISAERDPINNVYDNLNFSAMPKDTRQMNIIILQQYAKIQGK